MIESTRRGFGRIRRRRNPKKLERHPQIDAKEEEGLEDPDKLLRLQLEAGPSVHEGLIVDEAINTTIDDRILHREETEKDRKGLLRADVVLEEIRGPIVPDIEGATREIHRSTPSEAGCIRMKTKGDMLLEKPGDRLGDGVDECPKRDLLQDLLREGATIIPKARHEPTSLEGE